MEWHFTVRGLGDELISEWDGPRIKSLTPQERACFRQAIDSCGQSSAQAQGLFKVITSTEMILNTGHVLYLAATKSHGTTMVQGLLKVGKKKLFICVDSGVLQEIEPLCVLDFYVHETCQRSGLGFQLMDFMLKNTREVPVRLGYDRPSPKLIAFLRKHYGLSDYVPQNNNFVVFKQYFTKPVEGPKVRASYRPSLPWTLPSAEKTQHTQHQRAAHSSLWPRRPLPDMLVERQLPKLECTPDLGAFRSSPQKVKENPRYYPAQHHLPGHRLADSTASLQMYRHGRRATPETDANQQARYGHGGPFQPHYADNNDTADGSNNIVQVILLTTRRGRRSILEADANQRACDSCGGPFQPQYADRTHSKR